MCDNLLLMKNHEAYNSQSEFRVTTNNFILQFGDTFTAYHIHVRALTEPLLHLVLFVELDDCITKIITIVFCLQSF